MEYIARKVGDALISAWNYTAEVLEFGSKNKAPTSYTPECIPGAPAAFYPPYLAPLSREISKETTTNASSSKGFKNDITIHLKKHRTYKTAQTKNFQDEAEKRYAIQKNCQKYRKYTKHQRTAMRNREKRIPLIKKQSRKDYRDACYRNQNHISDGSGEPKESVSRKSKNADIARSERGSIYFTSHFQLGSNAENAYI